METSGTKVNGLRETFFLQKKISHYRPKPVEETITVVEKESSAVDNAAEGFLANERAETTSDKQVIEGNGDAPKKASEPLRTVRQMTRKELFDELYGRYIDLPKRERKLEIMYGMEPYFDTVEKLKWYVDLGFDRKGKELARAAYSHDTQGIFGGYKLLLYVYVRR